MKHICPKGYQSELTLLETQQAIKILKDCFQQQLSAALNLTRDTLRVEDMRGGKLLLFTSPWNVDWAV